MTWIDEHLTGLDDDGADDATPPQQLSRLEALVEWWGGFIRKPTLLMSSVMTILMLCGSVTAASLTESAQSDEVITVGGQLLPPATGPTFVRLAGALRVEWTAPGSGITPQHYETWRRDPAGSYPAGALGTSTVSPYDDTSVVQCNEYYYRLRSRHENMASVYTAEARVLYDTIAPTMTASAVVATSGPSPIANWLKPLGQYYVYATVNDNCLSDQSGVSVKADLRNLGELVSGTTLTFGSYTPVTGGPTYNFRAGPFTTTSLLDGTNPAWNLDLTDPVGNTANVAGATVTVDGVAPTPVRTPQITDGQTNYYAPELGYGEIRRGKGYRVYAEMSDSGSGVHANGVTSNTSKVTLTGATASALTAGTYATDNGIGSWNFRTASLTSCGGAESGCPADGSVVGFSVTATDAVGNSATVGDQTSTSVAKVEIDTTALTLNSCDASSSVAGNAKLDGNADGTAFDRNVLPFNDTVDPGRLAKPGGAEWTGVTATLTGNMVLHDGSLFIITTDFLRFDYLTLLSGGTTTGDASSQFDLGSGSWLTSGSRTYGSSFTRDSPSQFTAKYWKNSTSVPALTTLGTMRLSALTDAAGNGLSATDVTCSLLGW